MEMLLLGTSKIVSDKTIRNVWKTSPKEWCMCMCVLYKRCILVQMYYDFTEETENTGHQVVTRYGFSLYVSEIFFKIVNIMIFPICGFVTYKFIQLMDTEAFSQV